MLHSPWQFQFQTYSGHWHVTPMGDNQHTSTASRTHSISATFDCATPTHVTMTMLHFLICHVLLEDVSIPVSEELQLILGGDNPFHKDRDTRWGEIHVITRPCSAE